MFGFQKFIGGKPSSTAGMTDHLLKKTLQVAPVDERIALYYGRGQIRDDPAIALARDVAGGSKAFSEAPDEALSDYLKNGGDLDTRDRHCHVNLEMEWYGLRERQMTTYTARRAHVSGRQTLKAFARIARQLAALNRCRRGRK